MKLFTKVFLCILLVATASLSVFGYTMISNSFDNALNRECQQCIHEYQILDYAFRSVLLETDTKISAMDREKLESSVQQIVSLLRSTNRTAVIVDNSSIIQSTFPAEYNYPDINAADRYGLVYTFNKSSDGYWIVVTGRLIQSGEAIYILVSKDITSVMIEKANMQQRFVNAFIAILGVSVLVSFGLSILLTEPIKQLACCTSRFSNGKFDERAKIRGTDEISELSSAFNQMASTIQNIISQLELNVQQKEDFVANFAHELKTPLTSVIGYADLIYQNNEMTQEEIKGAAEYIINEGMRLESLSFKLMDLILLNKHNFTLMEIRIDEIITDVANAFRPLMQRDSIELSTMHTPAYVRVEIDLFKVLLTNLIDNARKAGSKKIIVSGMIESQNYVITISDDGCGIPSDKLARITEAFYMVDKSRSRLQHGAGLGLAIAARIAQLHETKLEYQSEVGIGTSVKIELKMEGIVL